MNDETRKMIDALLDADIHDGMTRDEVIRDARAIAALPEVAERCDTYLAFIAAYELQGIDEFYDMLTMWLEIIIIELTYFIHLEIDWS